MASTYEQRQAIRDANPGVIVDENSVYNPQTGQEQSIASYGGGGSSGGGGGGGSAPQVPAPVAPSSLDEQFRRMLEALASGNRERFEYEKEVFNRQFEESKRQFELGRSDSLAQFERNFGLSVGSLTGQYNGQPTEAARQFNQNMSQRQTEFGANLGTTLLNAATGIRGPRDYLQYQQLTRGGQNLLQQLYGNQPITLGGQPTGQLESANLGTVLGNLGITAPGGAGAGGADPRADLLRRFGLSAGQQLNPTQIDPARWDAMGQIGRDLTKNLAETSFGYDPTDFEAQVNATRPMGQASRRTAMAYAQPRGIY